MRYLEAPEEYELSPDDKSIFLAGGISACHDWQASVKGYLGGRARGHRDDNEYVILNPRRENYPIDDPKAVEEQISWEHNAMRAVRVIVFWFPSETLCPIALYELGAWSMTDKPIYVGVNPKYQRKQDVEIQTRLVRPNVKIEYGLDGLFRQVRNHQWE